MYVPLRPNIVLLVGGVGGVESGGRWRYIRREGTGRFEMGPLCAGLPWGGSGRACEYSDGKGGCYGKHESIERSDDLLRDSEHYRRIFERLPGAQQMLAAVSTRGGAH